MLKLGIHTDNAAFADDMLTEEVARILRAIADRIEGEHRMEGSAIDANGNKVGNWILTK